MSLEPPQVEIDKVFARIDYIVKKQAGVILNHAIKSENSKGVYRVHVHEKDKENIFNDDFRITIDYIPDETLMREGFYSINGLKNRVDNYDYKTQIVMCYTMYKVGGYSPTFNTLLTRPKSVVPPKETPVETVPPKAKVPRQDEGLTGDELNEALDSMGIKIPDRIPLPISSSFCANCNTTENKSLRCTGCNIIFYCSRECQKEDWKLHKNECGKLAKMSKEAKETAEKGGNQLSSDMFKAFMESFKPTFPNTKAKVVTEHVVRDSEVDPMSKLLRNIELGISLVYTI